MKFGNSILATLVTLSTLVYWSSGQGNRAAEPAAKPTVDGSIEVSFQQGVGGYQGTIDTEVWALATKTILSDNPNASSDANNDGGESQVLMRFDGIIGSKSNQVPPRCRIVSARLIVSAFDQGSTVNLHKMLVPFDESATWDSLVSGVSADGYEAARHKDGFTFGKIAASSSGAVFDVTDTLQGWVNGQANHGWVFLNTGGNGWDFYASEFDKVEQRPKLVVRFQQFKPEVIKAEAQTVAK
ncbi:MAG: DNRLRE domain-containing protein [Pirellulaceae bacterium]|nr:DNRLRE domain-containing protein [Pirellulaceae bacterium]